MWADGGGSLGHSGGDGVGHNAAGSESDVSSTTLEETVRIPLEQWPDSLLLTATGVRNEALAVDLLSKVSHLFFSYVSESTGAWGLLLLFVLSTSDNLSLSMWVSPKARRLAYLVEHFVFSLCDVNMVCRAKVSIAGCLPLI